MTILVICSVHDSAAGGYAPPMFLPSPAYAMRSFQQEVQRQAENNILHQHPEDFTLYEIGTFDDQTATFVLNDPPRVIARAKDLKATG